MGHWRALPKYTENRRKQETVLILQLPMKSLYTNFPTLIKGSNLLEKTPFFHKTWITSRGGRFSYLRFSEMNIPASSKSLHVSTSNANSTSLAIFDLLQESRPIQYLRFSPETRLVSVSRTWHSHTSIIRWNTTLWNRRIANIHNK